MKIRGRLANGIYHKILDGKLKKPFTVKEVNEMCNDLLKKSPSFLSKHCKGNPGNYNVYFVRVSRGKYWIIEKLLKKSNIA